MVGWSRRGLFRRIAAELGGLRRLRAQLAGLEAEMTAVLGGELGLSRLGDIPALTLTVAAVILAEAGGPCPGSAQAAQAGRAARAKARVACAAALLRWVCFMTVHGAGRDPVAASGGRVTPEALPEAA